MRLIIAGGRHYDFTEADYAWLDALAQVIVVSEVVSGGASGADSYGVWWARSRAIPVRLFYAEWQRLGKRAGFARNAEMAAYGNALALFPGGAGTANMRRQAELRGLPVYLREEWPLR